MGNKTLELVYDYCITKLKIKEAKNIREGKK